MRKMEKNLVRTFKEMKRKSRSGETLDNLAFAMRFNLGSHKKTRLKKAGVANSRSLLHDDISKKHADKLFDELNRRAKALGKTADQRLRFMTVLQELTEPTIEDVESAVDQLEYLFKSILGSLKLWSRGTIELEMVNLDILERIGKARDDEQRKMNVLLGLWTKEDFQGLMVSADKTKSKILVHCHVVVDLGKDFENNEEALRNLYEKERSWKRTKYQVDLKRLFKNRRTSKNLASIAAYVTKGGNENLRYNAGFGRDLAEDLDAKIWRHFGVGRSARGGETVADERGLTVGEVRQLDELYVWLMNRRKDKRGYLLWTNGR
jgi:hypothetical protein